VGVLLTDGAADILCGTSGGNAIRFNEADARTMGRAAHGVRAIRLGEDDTVVGVSRLTGVGRLLAVTENGYGKRVELDEYRTQNRGGKGLISYATNEKTGKVAGIRVVEDTDDALFISSDGVIIRVPVTEIPVYSRYAQGVRVMRVAEGTQVVTVAHAPHEDEEEDDTDIPEGEELAEDISDRAPAEDDTTK
jgi:DNA gyrase subunit A